MGERDALQRHESVRALLLDLRRIFGATWDRYELISPGTLRYKGDARFFHAVRRIIGRQQKFEEAEVEFALPLRERRLYLYSPSEKDALEFVPFVKVMPSPKAEANACYFYSRQANTKLRFISYHFEQESEIEEPDDDASKLIEALTPSGAVARATEPV